MPSITPPMNSANLTWLRFLTPRPPRRIGRWIRVLVNVDSSSLITLQTEALTHEFVDRWVKCSAELFCNLRWDISYKIVSFELEAVQNEELEALTRWNISTRNPSRIQQVSDFEQVTSNALSFGFQPFRDEDFTSDWNSIGTKAMFCTHDLLGTYLLIFTSLHFVTLWEQNIHLSIQKITAISIINPLRLTMRDTASSHDIYLCNASWSLAI